MSDGSSAAMWIPVIAAGISAVGGTAAASAGRPPQQPASPPGGGSQGGSGRVLSGDTSKSVSPELAAILQMLGKNDIVPPFTELSMGGLPAPSFNPDMYMNKA